MRNIDSDKEYVLKDESDSQDHVSVSDSSENISVTDSDSNVTYDLNTRNLKIKPEHWTEAYWETITSQYKWFIHIDGKAGCSICYSNKTFMGKKSLIATFKLRLMNLSYEEFEKKLLQHNDSSQHVKSLVIHKDLAGKSNNGYEKSVNSDLNVEHNSSQRSIKRPFPFDLRCPLCKKEYKLKKSLAKHIFFCNVDHSFQGFLSPCDCSGCILYSINDIDDHNVSCHQGLYRFNCKYCRIQHLEAAVLFDHLLMFHDYLWNPHKEMPLIIVKLDHNDDTLNVDRNNIDLNGSNNKIEKITNRDKKETSHLKLSMDQIYTCEYCGGRYLSINILTEHMRTRHGSTQDSDDEENNYKRRCHRRSLTNEDDKLSNHKKRSGTDDSSGRPSQVSASLLTCPLCQEYFPALDHRNDHVAKQHPEIQQFICHHCGLIFTNHLNYSRHLEKSHNCVAQVRPSKSSLLVTFSCTSCPLVFTNQADLSHHTSLSHVATAVVEVAEAESVETDSLLLRLVEADPAERRSVCTQCDLTAHNDYEMAVHAMTHGADTPWQSCPNCSRLFFGRQRKAYLKDHYNMEHLRKAAPCCVPCGGVFLSSCQYDLHLVHGVCRPGAPAAVEPYLALMEEERVAFSCAQCGLVLAGEDARMRLETHSRTCTLELMDDDEFLDG